MTRKLFGFLVKLFQQVHSSEAKIALAVYCGNLASKNYCGTFRESTFDAFFKAYASKNNNEFPALKVSGSNQVVHVLTTIYTTGGHTRFVENLVQLDDHFQHHLLISDQGETPIRQSLIDLIKLKGGKVLFLQKGNINEQTKELQQFLSENAAKIMLHIHPHDILPSIALQNKPKNLEVYFFNHADHLFSYGCDVADTIINIREEAHRISIHERNMTQSCILPLPIIKKDAAEFNIEQIREKYGVRENEIIGVSIGNTVKFYRNNKHHFFKTIFTALQQNPLLRLFVVGISPSDFCNELDVTEHERLHFLGLQKDPSELQRIADIAFDPMPIGSYTALLETCFYGAYPLVCYDTIYLFDLYTDAAFIGKINLDSSEQDYLNHLKRICDGNVELSKNEITQSIKETHTGNDWLNQLHLILNGKALIPKSETPLPTEISRFYELNLPDKKNQYSTLSFFYENIHLFTRKEVLKIVLHLISNRYSVKETLGIIKKHMVNK